MADLRKMQDPIKMPERKAIEAEGGAFNAKKEAFEAEKEAIKAKK